MYQSIFIPALICSPERRMITQGFLCGLSSALEIRPLQGAAKSQEDLVVMVFNRAPLKSLHGEVFWAFLSGRRPQTRPRHICISWMNWDQFRIPKELVKVAVKRSVWTSVQRQLPHDLDAIGERQICPTDTWR